jgi:hypothetical protein
MVQDIVPQLGANDGSVDIVEQRLVHLNRSLENVAVSRAAFAAEPAGGERDLGRSGRSTVGKIKVGAEIQTYFAF